MPSMQSTQPVDHATAATQPPCVPYEHTAIQPAHTAYGSAAVSKAHGRATNSVSAPACAPAASPAGPAGEAGPRWQQKDYVDVGRLAAICVGADEQQRAQSLNDTKNQVCHWLAPKVAPKVATKVAPKVIFRKPQLKRGQP
eukprot:354318-Chlamydomonas_euryale.AAC.22